MATTSATTASAKTNMSASAMTRVVPSVDAIFFLALGGLFIAVVVGILVR